MFCFWPECLGFLLPHGNGPGADLEVSGKLSESGHPHPHALLLCQASTPGAGGASGWRGRWLVGASGAELRGPTLRLRPAPVGRLGCRPARASRSCWEPGQLKPDTWLLAPWVAAQEGGTEAWAFSGGQPGGGSAALFVLAPAEQE